VQNGKKRLTIGASCTGLKQALCMASLATSLAGCLGVAHPELISQRLTPLADPVPTASPPVGWWTVLNDPVLDDLAAKALEGSFSVQAAAIRLKEAQGLDASNIWTLGPKTQLSDQFQGTHTMKYQQDGLPPFTFPHGLTDTKTKSFQATWELPLFGKAAAVKAQGRAKMEQTRYQLEAARLAVVAELVRDYASWQGSCAEVSAFEEEERTFTGLEELEFQVKAAGYSTQAEIDKLETQRLGVVAQLNTAQSQRTQFLVKIAALLELPDLAQVPAGIQECSAAPLPAAPLVIEIPANALRLRPDVRVAEELVALAAAQAGAAHAATFPQLTLGGSLIFNTGALDTYGGTMGVANVRNITGGLTIPLLDWFSLHAQAKAAKTELQATVFDYRQTLMGAWDETRESFEDYGSALVAIKNLEARAELAHTDVLRTRSKAARGFGTRQEILKAELAFEEARRAVTDAQTTSLVNWAKLEKASFVVYDLPPPPPKPPLDPLPYDY